MNTFTVAELLLFAWLAYLAFGRWRGTGSLDPDVMSEHERTAWLLVNIALAVIFAAIMCFADLQNDTLFMCWLFLIVALRRAWRCLFVLCAITDPYYVGFYRRYGCYPDGIPDVRVPTRPATAPPPAQQPCPATRALPHSS